jgi:hypothetical protein
MDERAHERQTLGRVCRAFTRRVCRLENGRGSFLDSVRRSDRHQGQKQQTPLTERNWPLRIQSSRTRGMIMCDRRGHGVCQWCDRRICHPRRVLNGSFQRGTSIYICWLALGYYSWLFDILDNPLSWATPLPLISLAWSHIQSEIEWSKCIYLWFCI